MTLKKEQIFADEPIGDKPTDALPGINSKNAEELAEAGFEFAYQLLGQFLLLKEDKVLFIEWLGTFDISENKAEKCYECIEDYRKKYI